MNPKLRLDHSFFHRECLDVAQDLVGKVLVHRCGGEIRRLRITETEAYCGVSDTACHASKGKTKRTEVLWMEAGTVYLYLCYGIHWLLNIVTGEENDPQAVLIRACEGADGPGKLTKQLGINGQLNRSSVLTGDQLWIEDDGFACRVAFDTRIGIGYAAEEDQQKLWRFKLIP